MLHRLIASARRRLLRGPSLAFEQRSDYKTTWQRLSTTVEDAKTYVSGTTDEEHFARSGVHTVGLLQRFVGIRTTDTILEIGCGVGRVGKLLSPLCARWIGTDISANMIGHAKARLHGLPNVSFVELSGDALKEIPDESVDLVYCTVVFMHLLEWDRYRYVHDAFRVLKKGGRVFYDNVDITSDHGRKTFEEALTLNPLQRPAHLSMTSSGDELFSYARWAGFENIEVHRWDGAWVGVAASKPA